MKEQEPIAGAWCRLLRIPNYFTVPGDVVAGFALAGGTRHEAGVLGWAVLVSLCLYAVGILLNDLTDLDVDRRERPSRPLPSGAISIRQAQFATLGFLLVAACLIGAPVRTAALPAVSLAGMVIAYNLGLKHVAILGEWAIATCRALNLFLGARVAVVGPAPVPAPVLLGCAVLFAYVFGLALLARREVTLGIAPWIGHLVRGLILVQALLIALAGEPLLSVLVAALWIPSSWLGRQYPSS